MPISITPSPVTPGTTLLSYSAPSVGPLPSSSPGAGMAYYVYGATAAVVAPPSGRIVLACPGAFNAASGVSGTITSESEGGFLSSMAAGSTSSALSSATTPPAVTAGFLSSDNGQLAVAALGGAGAGATAASAVSYSGLTPGQTYYVRPYFTILYSGTPSSQTPTVVFPLLQALAG